MDVTDATFEQDVVERSRTTPVVVDFWAAWCGPCRQLTPVLERAVDAHGDEIVLAKIDVDANPRVASRFDVRGIPAVKAFKDGRVVDEFTGVIPPASVDTFLARLVPSEAERLVHGGDEESLRRAIELEPARADARVDLARLLLGRGEQDEALALLRPVEHDREAAGLLARAELAADPAAPEGVAAALSALARGEHEVALAGLLEAVSASQGDVRDRVRRVMVGVFGELGDDAPLSVGYRRQLARALY
ncbi:MAG TPA: tetratricopeptide repeat protein [Gaiellales bacterium]